jgi:hypothetical protein
MTDEALQHSAPAVRIDRLVLDIPGLDPGQGRALALGIAEGLAAANVEGPGSERATVSVPFASAVDTPADLAARIVAALVERLA